MSEQIAPSSPTPTSARAIAAGLGFTAAREPRSFAVAAHDGRAATTAYVLHGRPVTADEMSAAIRLRLG